MITYLLDANVFMSANRLHYGIDFCPGFWDWLKQRNAARQVYSIEAVKTEIAAGKDALATWAAALGAGFFLQPDHRVSATFSTVSTWASSQRYSTAAQAEFLAAADYFLVSHALAHKFVVVTQEMPAPTSKKRIKIPDACNALNVKWLSPFEMLRIERASFVLAR